MEVPTILIIDDSPTIRKMVECHLTQAGYRVETAVDAERGITAAASLHPDLILLDHQLPGTTGDDVCRQLLANQLTAHIPVVISSALRNRAFVSYTEFPNVVDQIPKPFTPEMLKSGVANALQTGAMIVRAQQTGSAVPETVGDVPEADLEGSCASFPARVMLDLVNNGLHAGRLTVELDRHRIHFGVASGRIQAVYSTTITPESIASSLPPNVRDLSPLLAATLGERLDPSMTGLVRMLEQSLGDPGRLRLLLRAQSAILAYQVLSSQCGRFAFERGVPLPPMFQAFPLQTSLAALAVEGQSLCGRDTDTACLGSVVFARKSKRGCNPDRTGMSPAQVQAAAAFDGILTLAGVAERVKLSLSEAAQVALGLELAGILERRELSPGASILLVEDDPDCARLVQSTLGPDGQGFLVRVVRDRIGAQLLLRRERFDLVLLNADKPGTADLLNECRSRCPEARLIGIVGLDGEEALNRIDQLGLDALLHRPLATPDLLDTVRHLMNHLVPA